MDFEEFESYEGEEIDMKKFVKVNHKRVPKISRASKTHGIDGKPANSENPSEWALSYAFQKFKDGEVVEYEQIVNAVQDAVIQQALDELIENGLVNMHFDEEKNDFVYSLTDKGVKVKEADNG